MKYWLLFFPLSTLFLVVQTTLWTMLLPQAPCPNTTLLIILYLGFQAPFGAGGICAFTLGCLLDVFSGVTFGFHAIILLTIFMVTAGFRRQLNADNPLVLPFATIVGTGAFALLSIFILLLFSDRDQVWPQILSSIPMQIIVNLVAVLILRPLFTKLGLIAGLQSTAPFRRQI
ncbi:MAG: rod shape-determining protein MreD [Desulfuromonadaceae bacterium]|nr:rod shape-determining protein MreD [Desulfuromonas sp.]MDY0185445.1 rod shape-determining protein MreD [Desulfuromonadaceae bacterium]